jgi:hypothetical protein
MPGNLRHSLTYSFRFVFQGKVGLRDDPNDAVFFVDDWDSSNLVFLHQALAILHILTITADRRIVGNEFLDCRRLGSRPCASTRQHRSRSVITPINERDWWSATTGIAPTFKSHIILATFRAVSFGVQQAGSMLMTSLTFMTTPWK